MSEITVCPQCGMENCYFDGMLNVCPDCNHEFSESETEEVVVPKDSNGAILSDGDSVTVIKDLKVKGSSMVIKRGTKASS